MEATSNEAVFRFIFIIGKRVNLLDDRGLLDRLNVIFSGRVISLGPWDDNPAYYAFTYEIDVYEGRIDDVIDRIMCICEETQSPYMLYGVEECVRDLHSGNYNWKWYCVRANPAFADPDILSYDAYGEVDIFGDRSLQLSIRRAQENAQRLHSMRRCREW